MPSAPPDLDPSRVHVVLNSASRRGAALAGSVRDHLDRAGLRDARLHAVPTGAELLPTLDRVLEEQPDLLVVGGGDGTVGAAAERLAGTGTVLGVLPLGTANDFARTLQIPSALEAATRTLVTGKVVDVDLGRARGYGPDTASLALPFLNVASLGLSVAVTERLGPRLKRRLGPLAYPAATLAAYRHHRPFSARLEFPDGDHPTMELDDLLQVAVGNGVHYGGGQTVSPTASVDDHTLDVYAIVRGRLRDHVSIARFLKDGSFVEPERVHHGLTRRVRGHTGERMGVNLDGEIALRTPVDFRVERNALHVVVPQHSTAAVKDAEAA